MSRTTSIISGEHRAMLVIEGIHAVVVVAVVVCATILAFVQKGNATFDAVGVVYGAAIAYAGGRASSARQALTRGTDRGSVG